MKKLPLVARRILLGCAALVALWMAYPLIFFVPGLRDFIWRQELISALDNAATVTVAEHSNLQEQFRVGHPPKIYGEVTLCAEQIAGLRQLFLQVTDETPTDGILKCKFDEHHYIEMTASDGSTRTVLLCFGCGQYYLGDKPTDKWTYSKLGKMSESWKSSMSKFISSRGLHPSGPWWGPDAVVH